MSRFYWHCPLCGSEGTDTIRSSVEHFGQAHRCIPTPAPARTHVWIVRPHRNVRIRVAGRRRLRSGGA